MNQLKAALEIIFGNKPDGYYIAGLFFSVLGILISLYHSSKKRDPQSPNTPVKFSLLFLIWDNFKRGSITLIVMFIVFRVWDVSDIILMIGVGIGVALSLDKLIELMMNKWDWICKLLSQDRDRFPQKPTS